MILNKLIIILILQIGYICNSQLLNDIVLKEEKIKFKFDGGFQSLISGANSYYFINTKERPGIFELQKLDGELNIDWVKSFGYFNSNSNFKLEFPLTLKEGISELLLVSKYNPYYYISTDGHLKIITLNRSNGEVIHQGVDTSDVLTYITGESTVKINDNNKILMLNKYIDDSLTKIAKIVIDSNGRRIKTEDLNVNIPENEIITNTSFLNPSNFIVRTKTIGKSTNEEKYYYLSDNSVFNFNLKSNESLVSSIFSSKVKYLYFQKNTPEYFSDSLIYFTIENNNLQKYETKLPFEFKTYTFFEYGESIIAVGLKAPFNVFLQKVEKSYALIKFNLKMEIENYFVWEVGDDERILDERILDVKITMNNLRIVGRTYEDKVELLYNCIIDLDKFVKSPNSVEVNKSLTFEELLNKFENSNIQIYNLNGIELFSGSIYEFKALLWKFSNQKLIVKLDGKIFKLIYN